MLLHVHVQMFFHNVLPLNNKLHADYSVSKIISNRNINLPIAHSCNFFMFCKVNCLTSG